MGGNTVGKYMLQSSECGNIVQSLKCHVQTPFLTHFKIKQPLPQNHWKWQVCSRLSLYAKWLSCLIFSTRVTVLEMAKKRSPVGKKIWKWEIEKCAKLKKETVKMKPMKLLTSENAKFKPWMVSQCEGT